MLIIMKLIKILPMERHRDPTEGNLWECFKELLHPHHGIRLKMGGSNQR